MKELCNLFFSQWIQKEFGAVGKDMFICWPLSLKGAKQILIGDYFTAGCRNRIETWDEYGDQVFKPQIIIGNNVSLNNDCHIGAIKKIQIGDNVLLASRVFITDHFHGDTTNRTIFDISPALRPLVVKGEVIIKDNVWVGEGAVILPGVTVGKGAIIGANAVVTKNVPDYAVVAGIPAKVIKQL